MDNAGFFPGFMPTFAVLEVWAILSRPFRHIVKLRESLIMANITFREKHTL